MCESLDSILIQLREMETDGYSSDYAFKQKKMREILIHFPLVQ